MAVRLPDERQRENLRRLAEDCPATNTPFLALWVVLSATGRHEHQRTAESTNYER